MTLTVTTVSNNPATPGIMAETYTPDQGVAGAAHLATQVITLAAGNLGRLTVLGQQTGNSVEVAAGSTNVGSGTVTAVSATSDAEIGAYLLTATGATTFAVSYPEAATPEGEPAALPNATVGTAYNSGGIAFTITAGGTAFAAGDKFSLTTVDSVGNFIESVKTASDGSQTPCAILADAANATNGPVTTGAYVMGEFNVNALTFDPGQSLENPAWSV